MNDLNCPYCDAELEVCHDDGFGYDEDVAHEMECYKCGKNFTFQTSISFNYIPKKADCLNGSPHEFSDWKILAQWADTSDTIEQIEGRRCMSCDLAERRTTNSKRANK